MEISDWINNVSASNNLDEAFLQIDNLDELKITKIRYDKLYFKYKNERYFVIAQSDCGDMWYALYKKDFVDGHWKVTFIKSSGWTFAKISCLLDNKTKGKRNIVYSHIDKEYFVRQLKEDNLIMK